MDAAAGGPVWPAGRGLAWFWVTRPVRLLTAQVAASGQDSISAIKTLAARRPEPRPGNEVAVLENRFIDLARQIADQWDRLADSDRQRREFVANISHDLRTPLTSLLGYLETLTLKDEWLTAEERRQYLTIALRQGTKCAISRSSCLSWRDWSMAALSRSASVSRWGADFRRGAEV